MISGHKIFYLVHRNGLPLDIINLELKNKGEAFNIEEFVESAIIAGWTRIRVENTLVYNCGNLSENNTFRALLNILLDKHFKIN